VKLNNFIQWIDEIAEREKNNADDLSAHDATWFREKPIQYLAEFEIVTCVDYDYGLYKPLGKHRHLMSRHIYD